MPHNTPEKRRAYLEATKERRALRQKAYNDSHREQQDAWRNANREKVREMERARYAVGDKEKQSAKDRAYYEAHAEEKRAKARAYGPAPARDQPLYSVWTGMKTRCLNPRNKDWKNYGGRGITICGRWRDDYKAFEDDMLPGYQPGMKIERIDNDGPYTPRNCRWATPKEQNRNFRHNIRIETPWGTMLLADAAELAGINYVTLYWRWKHGRPLFPEML